MQVWTIKLYNLGFPKCLCYTVTVWWLVILPDTPGLLLHCSDIPSVSFTSFTHLCIIANYFMDWFHILKRITTAKGLSLHLGDYASSQAEAVIVSKG